MQQGNPIAERRRQRKLENERLEQEAKRLHEDALLQQELERERLEQERLEAERRLLIEREEARQRKQAEAERVAALEEHERRVILGVERRLKLVGAFCTLSVKLPTIGGVPTCVAVLQQSDTESAIGTVVQGDVVFVADSKAGVHVFARQIRSFLFSMVLVLPDAPNSWPVIAMNTTRSGLLLGVAIVRLRDLFQAYHTSRGSNASIMRANCTWASLATAELCIHAIAYDDTSGELFISDQANHQIVVCKLGGLVKPEGEAVNGIARRTNAAIRVDCAFGRQGSGNDEMRRPTGLDVSHYHVIVCDSGNSRLAVFTKRGGFVNTIGKKGSGPCEFVDVRDVKIANVRKSALSRGRPADENTISNEQFDLIVADLGNFRVQVLDASGTFVRQFSLLAGIDQVSFQHSVLASLSSTLLREYSCLNLQIPSLAGDDMSELQQLATVLHPNSLEYVRITQSSHELRSQRSRFHHPFALEYICGEREVVVVDRDNASLHLYNLGGSRCNWRQILATEPQVRLMSMHSIVQQTFASGDCFERRLYISDPAANRIAVVDEEKTKVLRLIGASTYGDQAMCSPGFLDGELNHPTFLAVFHKECQGSDICDSSVLVVSDSGNHSVSLFNAWNGAFCGRIGQGFGHDDGYFDSPQGVAVLDNELLFVADQRNHRIQVFDLKNDKRFVRAFGGLGVERGHFNLPTGVAVCPALPATPPCDFGPHRDAKVVVADTGNYRIQVLDLMGAAHFVLTMDSTPFELPLSPIGVCIEQRSGYFFACDAANKCIAVFRSDGVLLACIGASLEEANQFARPANITISKSMLDSENRSYDRLLITDAVRLQLCVFDLEASNMT